MSIKYADEIEKEIEERGQIQVLDGYVTGEEFEQWLRDKSKKYAIRSENDIYLIVEHSFDSLENYNPEYTEVVGYVEDELEADAWIDSQGDRVQYKGYNGKMYPYYTKQKIEKIAL